MSRFTTTLKTEQFGKWSHTLLDDLVLEDDLGEIIVPAGYQTDFASIRTLHNAAFFILFALVAATATMRPRSTIGFTTQGSSVARMQMPSCTGHCALRA
jgi:hypothetical protein